MREKSNFKIVSVGIVAKDILEDAVYADIYPVELQPNVSRELSIPDLYTHQVTNALDEVEIVTSINATLITAKWLPDGDTNRLEPPTICKGEVVVLYKYSDDDKYYWKPLYNQLDLRKLEKRTIVLSNKKSINVPTDELLANTYSFGADTINKLIHLKVNPSDGEYTSWDISIDTAEGILDIIDGKDNQILWESQYDKLTININKDIEINTTNVTENISNDLTTTIGNNETKVIHGNESDTISGRYDIRLSSFTVTNDSNELISLLMDYVDVVTNALGIGNLGAPVPMDGGTKSNLQNIKSRLGTFL